MISTNRKTTFDWITMGIFLSLLITGWFSIYSATSSFEGNFNIYDIQSPAVKQIIYLAAALTVFIIVQFIDIRFWHTVAYLIYGFGVLALILVLIFGTVINGAKAWFNLGGFSFQPSELAKFGTILAVCSYLTYYKVSIKSITSRLTLIGIIFLPVFLILLQPDAGSALTFFSLFILLFAEGFSPVPYIIFFLLVGIFILSIVFPLPGVYFSIMLLGIWFCSFYIERFRFFWMALISVSIALIFLYFKFDSKNVIIAAIIILLVETYLLWKNRNIRLAAIMPFVIGTMILFSYSSLFFFSRLKEHQQERIKVWLKPEECDPRGSLYNIIQSKVAIGSGGFFGKGFLNGNMTKLKYVPEQSTDFIFSTIGEEQGFLGSVMVILLFTFLAWRMIDYSQRSPNRFSSTYALALAGFIMIHMLVNIGMTIGLVPIIGIPLPFISKGGTALIMFSLMVGIFVRLQSKNQ
ncbi:MAG: rod shape-determining protein RodA [Saprospiraceae bacterium]